MFGLTCITFAVPKDIIDKVVFEKGLSLAHLDKNDAEDSWNASVDGGHVTKQVHDSIVAPLISRGGKCGNNPELVMIVAPICRVHFWLCKLHKLLRRKLRKNVVNLIFVRIYTVLAQIGV